MPIHRVSFSIVWLIFPLKLSGPERTGPLPSIFALHNFQATAPKPGIAPFENRVPSKPLLSTQAIGLQHGFRTFRRWHVA
jgi:hypothetical protein